MTPTDDRFRELFVGVDAPRPVPSAIREQLETSLTSPLGGADRPRALPRVLRARLERMLVPAGRVTAVRRLRVLAVAAVVALFAGAAAVLGGASDDAATERALVRRSGSTVPDATTTSSDTVPPQAVEVDDPAVTTVDSSEAVRLQTFSSCSGLVTWAKTEAGKRVNEFGFGATGGGPVVMPGGRPPALPRTGGESAVAGSLADSGVSASVTNVQEAGVDEPDRVKTDGTRLYVSRSQSIVALDVSGDTPSIAHTLELAPSESVRGLLLDGSTLVALVDSYQHSPRTRLLAIDAPTLQITGERAVEGGLIDARLTSGRVHAVVVDLPDFAFTYPQDGSPAQAAAAKAANQQVIANSSADDWVPAGVACDDVRHPATYSGPSTTTVYSFEPANPAGASSASVLGNASMVYASQQSLYVATTDFDQMVMAQDTAVAPPAVTTAIHRFALGAAPSYVASGSVDGYLHSQWAMSERDGVLRVASTSGPPWRNGDVPSESAVTALRTDGDALVRVGHVGGLGQGQQIQGVRFVDEIGFVVTFLVTDPLYTIDLSNPEAPRVRGALEVPGFSAYLHPVPPGTLLGVGPDGDEEGRRQGESVSMYDVSNLDSPTMTQRLALGSESSYSPVESDHRAFLWYPRDSLAALPVYDYGVNSTYASVLTVTAAGVGERGRVTHDKRVQGFDTMPIDRLAIVDGVLYSISYGGVLASDLATLGDVAFIPLPLEQLRPIPVEG